MLPTFPLLLVAACLLGCRSAPLPPVDLQQPGWTVRQGEALWRPKRGLPEIAGELLVARSEHQAFVQFTKNPFPLVMAQAQSNRWELNLPLERKRFSGPGKPPRRILWFQLPLLMDDRKVDGWTLDRFEEHRWRVANNKTGESLEGILNP